MIEKLKAFENKRPEIVFEWKDTETEAEGWAVINSIRNGSTGGGTRMRKGLDKHEVESLAKTMEIKFTVSGPPIGGAKSGINFDPSDPRKHGVLDRWFKAVMPLLKSYYGTGGDLNVDEIHEVIPITAKHGLLHPQEGTAVGHFGNEEPAKTNRINRLKEGVSKIITDNYFSPDITKKYRVADMITGYGVAISVLHFYKLYGGTVKGKRVLLQGFGNVGAAAGYYLAQNGAIVTGMIDRGGGLVNKNGFSFDEVKSFLLKRDGVHLKHDNLIPHPAIDEVFWNAGAEIFIPAVASRLVTKRQLEIMKQKGLQVISCGANVPFADNEIFFGPIAGFADSSLSVIPDFIANCGMARVFAYLMSDSAVLEDDKIFEDVSETIFNALKKVHNRNSSQNNISETAFNIALERLMN